MIAIEYHADLKEVQSDPGLSELLSSRQQNAPFDRLGWWGDLARHCGLSPLLAAARDGKDMAVLVLREDSGKIMPLTNWYSFHYRPIISPGADGAALLAALAADLAQRTHRLTLAGLPDEDGSATLVENSFRAAGWVALREICDVNHILPVGGRGYDEYLAGRPGQLRTTLKRKSSKVECSILEHFDDTTWKIYEEIYGQSWKPAEDSFAFLRAFAQAEAAAGRLRLGLARADGRPVAVQMWTVEGGTAFIHKLAHLKSARPLSPGSVLTAALMRHVIDTDRVSLVDFGTGDDPYKRDWMESIRPRYRIDLLRPLVPRNWPIFVHGGLRRLAARRKRR